MPEYIVMFPADNEAEMDARSDAERQVVFDIDYEFGQLLALWEAPSPVVPG